MAQRSASGGGRGPSAGPAAAPCLLPVGDGAYELGPLIATGGMAELFLARRVGPGAISHPVVIKRLLPEMQADPAMARMFLWEAWISARLRHPNVVRFHDFVSHEQRHHLVLEHVPGCDLGAVMRAFTRAGRPFPIREALEMSIALLRALAHAHALVCDEGRPLGLVHRDVSPHNVLLSVDGEVKLTDFGVAKPTAIREVDPELPVEPPSAPATTLVTPVGPSARRIVSVGVVKGTPGYLAPEQLLGRPVDARTDLFAVGVILFELLSGRRLFRGRDRDELMQAVLLSEVPAIAPLRPGCPALLEGVVRRALAARPEDRFADAAEMEEALSDVLASLREPGGARAPGQGLAALVREVTQQASGAPRPAAGGRAPSRPPPCGAPALDREQATVQALVRTARERAPRRRARRRRARWVAIVALAMAAGAVARRVRRG